MKTTTKRHENRPLGVMTKIAAALCITTLITGCSMMSKPANEGISDADITSGVKAGLAAEPRLGAYKLQVKTDDGVVHLSGNVATGGDRDVAERIAADSRGVVRVDNYVQFGVKTSVVAP